jgi:hypothetical protein
MAGKIGEVDMSQGRSIGARIREVCEVLEQHGPNLRGCEVVVFMTGCECTNATKYLQRAVKHGLVIERRLAGAHCSYSAAPDWRALAEMRPAKRKRILPAPKVPSKAAPVKQVPAPTNVVALTNWLSGVYPGVIERKTKKGANDNKH